MSKIITRLADEFVAILEFISLLFHIL